MRGEKLIRRTRKVYQMEKPFFVLKWNNKMLQETSLEWILTACIKVLFYLLLFYVSLATKIKSLVSSTLKIIASVPVHIGYPETTSVTENNKHYWTQ